MEIEALPRYTTASKLLPAPDLNGEHDNSPSGVDIYLVFVDPD